ncbi:hypothetical protein [Helicobacter sp. T3_23-1056]
MSLRILREVFWHIFGILWLILGLYALILSIFDNQKFIAIDL